LVGGRRLEVDDDGLASDADDDDPEKLILTGKLVLAGVFAISSIAAILLSAVAESAAGRNEKKARYRLAQQRGPRDSHVFADQAQREVRLIRGAHSRAACRCVLTAASSLAARSIRSCCTSARSRRCRLFRHFLHGSGQFRELTQRPLRCPLPGSPFSEFNGV
jgi:hypothetical protein